MSWHTFALVMVVANALFLAAAMVTGSYWYALLDAAFLFFWAYVVLEEKKHG